MSAVAVQSTLGEHDLRRLEAALLDALLDVHRDRTNAVDRLLSDPEFAGREEVQELLTTALIDTHHGRDRALDRILDDLTRVPTAA